jgi:hypothetical protein
VCKAFFFYFVNNACKRKNVKCFFAISVKSQIDWYSLGLMYCVSDAVYLKCVPGGTNSFLLNGRPTGAVEFIYFS